jgi:membrane protein DedA with SNARE-associated domain
MGQEFLNTLRGYITDYGYWAVGISLLLENAGIPLPGETILLLASFLAYSQHELQLLYIILVGVCAATLGDNLGFAIGYRGGRPLLDRYRHIFRIPSARDCRTLGGSIAHALEAIRRIQFSRGRIVGERDLFRRLQIR